MKTRFLIIIVLAWNSMHGMSQQYSLYNIGSPSYAVTSFSVVNENVVWATGRLTSSTSNGGLRTTDGGITWQWKGWLMINFIEPTMITAIDSMTAWISMQPYYFNDPGKGIYKTSNGGATWNRQASAAFDNAPYAVAVHFWDANVGWCLGTNNPDGPFQMYTTSNGGGSWVEVPASNIPPTLGFESLYGLFSLSVVGNSVWFVTNIGRVFKSEDQGLSWTVSSTTIPQARFAIDFKNSTFGLCASGNNSGSVYSSGSGGSQWGYLADEPCSMINHMSYIPGTEGTFLITGNGNATFPSSFACSFDNGANWISDNWMNEIPLFTSAWMNDSTGWLGTLGGIYRLNGVLSLPVADFTASDSSIVPGEQIYFTNKSTKQPLSYKWTFDGGIPESSTEENPGPITYNQTGSFDVKLVTTNYYGQDSLVKNGYINVGTTGITNDAYSGISIFPNPIHDRLTVTNNREIESLKVLTILNQTILERKVGTKEASIDASGWNNGVYLILIETNNGTVVRKLVKH